MRKSIFIFLCLSLVFSIAQAKEITIKKLTVGETITIDGDDAEWPVTAVWQDMNQNKGLDVEKNNNAIFKMTYDDNFVYVSAKVFDNNLDTSQSANSWAKDCIEVFFVLNDTVIDGSAYYSSQLGAWQLRKIYGRDMTDHAGKGFIAAEQDIAGGYMQEWKLSWDTLASTGIWDGKKFRFECQNGDNDGSGRNSQLFWNKNTDDQWCVIANQGYIVLETPVASKNPTNGLALSQSSLSISSISGSYSINITCNADWTVQSNQSWLSIDKSSGTENNSLTVTASANNNGFSRTGSIIITSGSVSRTLVVIQSAAGMANAKAITIKKTTTAIEIDGDDSDWPESAVVQAMDQSKGLDENPNNTASFRMTYDDNFVYLTTKVIDGTLDTSQSVYLWEKDCIEVFFVLNDTVSEGTSYSSGQLGAWQLRKIYGRDMTDYVGKGFIAAEQDIAGGYIQEWKLSWDTLASTGIWDGKKFRFECQNGDNDGSGRNSQLFWNKNSDNQWNTILDQGIVVLETPVAPRNSTNSLILSQSSFSISSNIGSYSINITSNANWTAQSNQSWLTLDKSYGTGNSSLTVTASANNNGFSRTGSVSVTSDGVTRTLVVTQSAALLLSQSSFSISSNLGSYSINIISNANWTAQSNQSWLTLDKSSGTGDGYLRITASTNNDEISRVANVSVTSGNITKNLVVTQSGASCSVLLVAAKEELTAAKDELKVIKEGYTSVKEGLATVKEELAATKENLKEVKEELTVAKENLAAARDSMKMILGKINNPDSISVSIINMQDYTSIVNVLGSKVQLKLYPNPCKDKILVESDSPISQVEVLSVDGKQIYNKLLNTYKSSLELEGFKEGTYILKVYTDKGIVGGKFVIKK